MSVEVAPRTQLPARTSWSGAADRPRHGRTVVAAPIYRIVLIFQGDSPPNARRNRRRQPGEWGRWSGLGPGCDAFSPPGRVRRAANSAGQCLCARAPPNPVCCESEHRVKGGARVVFRETDLISRRFTGIRPTRQGGRAGRRCPCRCRHPHRRPASPRRRGGAGGRQCRHHHHHRSPPGRDPP